MTGGRPVVVAIDFDRTITRRDTVVPFMRRVAGTRALVAGLLTRVHRLVVAAARHDRDAIRAIGTDAVFRGRQHDIVAAHAVEHGREIVGTGLRPDVVARVGWHLEQAHLVVVVSASYESYVRVVADHLAVHGVAATRLEVADDGRLTGRLDGPNCRGPEKVVRLDAWLAGRGLRRDQVTLWAYGDSAGDRELLAAADHPVWVREPLASVAPI